MESHRKEIVRAISPLVRVRWWLGVFAGLFVSAACALTTDLDNLSSGGPARPDGGNDGSLASDAGSSGSAEGGAPPAEGGAEAGALTYGDLVMGDHPIAYFPFDEPSGSSFITEKISGKNATATKPNFALGAPGIAGTALAVTGHAEMDFGDMLDVVGKKPWTIEAWIKPELEDGKVFYEYFNKRENGNNGIVAYVRSENGHRTAQVEQSYSGGGRGVDAVLPALDHFIHIVFVYDPGGSGIRAWVDGQRSDAGYDDNGGPTDNAQPVYIASGVKGTIDEMAVYDYALADARIVAHYTAGKR